MSEARPRRSTAGLWALACLLLLGSSLPVAASAQGQFHALGCYTDPVGDTGGVAEADLRSLCVNYGDDVTTVEILHATAIDPIQDPAWANDGTAISALFSTDGSASPDVIITLRRQGDGFVVDRTDGAGTPLDTTTCPAVEVALVSGRQVDFQLRSSCLGGAAEVRVGGRLSYQAQAGGPVAMDSVPDELGTPPLPRGDSPPFCDNHSEDGTRVVVARLRCGGVITGTEPITQAVAVSQFVFDDLTTPQIEGYLGRWAVIVRNDNFADALAGSSLGFGQGPLLFTPSPTSGPALVPPQDPDRLAAATRQELLRTVPRGFPVYVLGGTAAVSEGVMDELRGLGYDAQRLAGASREETAAVVAREVRRLVRDFAARNPGFPDTNMVMIANRDNWPDAVLAGQVGALWGMPILLNPASGAGHPATLAALAEIRPDAIQFIGGRGVITSDTLNAIRDFSLERGFAMGRAGEAQVTNDTDVPWRQFCARQSDPEIVDPFWACRQGGATRLETAAAVSQFGREMILRFGGEATLIPDTEVYASAVPLAGGVDSDNYAYVLAASMMSGRFGGAVFLPTENQTLTETIKRSVCDIRRGKDTDGDGELDTPFIELVELVALMADTDKLTDAFGQEIRTLIEGGCPAEFQATGGAEVLVAAD